MKTFTIYSSCIHLVLFWLLHLNHFYIYITHNSSIFSNTCKYKPERLRYLIENFEYLSESMYSAWLVGLVSSVFITIHSLVITYLSWENNNGNGLSSYHIFMSKLKLILKNIKTCYYWYLEADNSDGFNNKISSRKRSAAKAFQFFLCSRLGSVSNFIKDSQ